MKSFIISVICIALLTGAGVFFVNYSDDTLHTLMSDLDDNIIIYVESEDWQTAMLEFDKFKTDWEKYRSRAVFFLSTISLNEASYAIEKVEHYMKAEDVSNSSGELAYIKELLSHLHFDESLSLGNIF